MDILTNVSIVAAFIAGVAALFAPCCITVLLPSYLGSVFQERYKVLLMTFVFFLGILAVFLPIGLGAAALARFFNTYHNFIFTLGGLMLSGLGIALILGKTFSIPSPVSARFAGTGALSIFLLGVFSAVATTCCAPVLAGVLALSAASGSIFWGGIYTLSYVLGMVAPLFLIAVFLDKVDFTERFATLHKTRTAKIGRFEWTFKPAELVAGLVFLGMGIYIIYLALANQLTMEGGYQLEINLFFANLVHSVHRYTQTIPEIAWALFVLAALVLIAWFSIYQFIRIKK
ncbi:MAG: cytochrome c biogenesis protein CcdA [Candidatus Kaiserbacteria bacterium]|nr:MAG: cytochrome c biogenesis protein CcdA [Candidatus Kaiserbacteria bacterium]